MKASKKSYAMSSLLHCCNWILSIKLSRIILTVLLLLIMIPILVHYYLSQIEHNDSTIIHRSNMKYDIPEDFTSLRASDLKMRIEEMLRIKASVSNELRNLEEKSKKIQLEITGYHQRIDSLKSDLSKEETELNKLKTSLRQAQLSRQEALQHNTPELALPLPLFPNETPQVYPDTDEVHQCHKMFNCFDYSRCSLTSGFPVYLYDPDEYLLSWEISINLKTLVKQTIGYNPHFTTNPKMACVFIALLGGTNTRDIVQLKELPFWGGDGRNHILLNLSRKNSSASDVRLTKDLGRSIVAQSFWWSSDFRINHDIVIPPLLGPPGGEVWQDVPYMLPARRRYILSFQGNGKPTGSFDVRNIEKYLSKDRSDDFHLEFECQVSETGAVVLEGEWKLCFTELERADVLKDSTFVLIPGYDNVISTSIIQTRLFEALKYGSIPVVIGGDGIEFPFSEKLDWNKVLISLPTSRVTECHWLIRSFSDEDLLLMRRQGRLVYERYLSTAQNLLDTVLTLVRDRIGIPPLPVPDYPAPSVFPADFKPLRSAPVIVDSEPEENLGPLEAPFSSPKYARNYSVIRTQSYEMWNEWGDPFRLYPHLPFDPVLPSDAKFMGSGFGFRVINGGAGGAGKEFCESLGGDWRKEQFTIVILTYEREQVLMNSISRLNGLPYLNKVIVVWNSPNAPLQDLRWPDIGAPIHVVSVRKNSLNNRFLPFEAIETEAVLSVDDDAHMRHDEIIFGFRVWREQRDRVVGFPGRFHALDLNYGGWLYNSNYSCELSMVLTGAAFVHKYYLYLYTYWLPQGIRDMVDQYMNCEDIAMNFLVSHVTRKPPVKVTSRWTFRCPGCPIILSEDESHFKERHHCINYFSKVFGYTPLLNTQFRADSVLFKTRIPHDKQKCFKFI